uniref:Uncharacterized protein n=1 Tax=Anguilla anguilla TaxID=7936 RepID=A0A0E9QIR6_ANGAN
MARSDTRLLHLLLTSDGSCLSLWPGPLLIEPAAATFD